MTGVTVTTPDISGVVDQDFFLRPLGGPQHPVNYLDRFPDEVYNKNVDSHLVKLMFSLLGPAGAGWLRKNYLLARLKFEDYGVSTFDLDAFYGNPLKFGRILEETYDDDPFGLLPRDQWQAIKAQDEAYRSRAIDYMKGARAGNTPLGMRLVARSGLGHEAEVIENYRYLYDQLTDDPLGLPRFGTTDSTEEFTVIPRRELPQSETQTITFTGGPNGGTWALFFPMGDPSLNTTTTLAYNATRFTVQTALEALPTIGSGNVLVSGDINIGFTVQFTAEMADMSLPNLVVTNNLIGISIVTVVVDEVQSGADQTDEVVVISPQKQYDLKQALNFIKPVATIVTYGAGSGLKSPQIFNTVTSSSEQFEVLRYVTGQTSIPWPARDATNWIERSVEHEGQRAADDTQHHYQGFHNVVSIVAYNEFGPLDPGYLTDIASVAPYRDEQIGPFSAYQQALFPVLATDLPPDYQYTADQALADYAEPLNVTNAVVANTETPTSLINGIYPVSYSSLPGVPPIRYKTQHFYASVERPTGDDYLELDLGEIEAVNYLSFEMTQKPYNISVAYDLLDLSPARAWQDITYAANTAPVTGSFYDASSINPWLNVELHFNNLNGGMIYTRRLRIKLSRRLDVSSPFTNNDGTYIPYSVEVRNLRVGRNIS